MGHICDATCEDKIRLDAAVAALEESSKRLMASFCADSGEGVETAFARFQLAKAQFSLARAICRDYQLAHGTAR